MPSCSPRVGSTRGSTRPSLPRSASSRRSPTPPGSHEGAEPLGAAPLAQQPTAPSVVLGHPSLYPIRLRHQPLDGGGRRPAPPPPPPRTHLHPALLPRAPFDDP